MQKKEAYKKQISDSKALVKELKKELAEKQT